MRTIIVGCGRVGAELAARLAGAGHEVTVLDLMTESFSRLPESFSGQAVRGDGTDEDVLRRAGAEGADNFIALTEGDNRNVLAAQMAAENLGIPNVVAKINDPVRADAYSSLGIATICRTTMMVDAMAGFLGEPTGRPKPGVSPPTGHHPGGDHEATPPTETATGNGSAAASTARAAAGAGSAARMEG
jgi:trk system potassium uptake protein TrkA